MRVATISLQHDFRHLGRGQEKHPDFELNSLPSAGRVGEGAMTNCSLIPRHPPSLALPVEGREKEAPVSGSCV